MIFSVSGSMLSVILNVLGQRGSPQSLGWNARVSVWPACSAGRPALPNSSSCSVPWCSSSDGPCHWSGFKTGCCGIVSQSRHDVWVQSWVIHTCMFLSFSLLFKFCHFMLRQCGKFCSGWWYCCVHWMKNTALVMCLCWSCWLCWNHLMLYLP